MTPVPGTQLQSGQKDCLLQFLQYIQTKTPVFPLYPFYDSVSNDERIRYTWLEHKAIGSPVTYF